MTDIQGIKSKLALFQKLFKMYLIIALIGLCSHCALLLCGIDCNFATYSVVLTLIPFAVLYVCTYVLKLCSLCRVVLCYNYLISNCIFWQRQYAAFGQYVDVARITTLGIGIILIIALVSKRI